MILCSIFFINFILLASLVVDADPKKPKQYFHYLPWFYKSEFLQKNNRMMSYMPVNTENLTGKRHRGDIMREHRHATLLPEGALRDVPNGCENDQVRSWPFFKKTALKLPRSIWVKYILPGKGGMGGYSKKFYTGRLRPEL